MGKETKKNLKELPRIPSKLLRLAMADLEKVEKDDRYDVNMNVWFDPSDEVCQVCLAGATMAKTLGFNRKVDFLEQDSKITEINDDQFDFLDEIRGYDTFGLEMLADVSKAQMRKIDNFILKLNQVHYEEDATLFKKNMLAIADKLEKLEL